jgi:uncharacterized protein (TIGR03032 family)
VSYKLSYTAEFGRLLQRTKSTLAISVYQAGKILLFDTDESGNLKITPISYPKPMGICSDGNKLAIATINELHIYKDEPQLAKKLSSEQRDFKHLYFPRQTFHCGMIDLHDIDFVNQRITGVNTLFSCICQFDDEHNFTPIWKPYFISENTPEDRCHLNGMAQVDGKLKYITALGHQDKPGSWRKDITNSGILMDIPENKILVDGLAMPHSPRWYNGKIYLLESAKGELVEIDPISFKKTTKARLNGLVRGLTIVDGLAFIGISTVREKSKTFNKLDDSVKAEHASIEIIDIASGITLGNLVFKTDIKEIYDVQLLQNVQAAGIFGLYDKRHNAGISTPDQVFWRIPKE